ncbi:unnamed protein product [Arctia plantaginis]|uniref:Uncharacterized protein n=1 Tax=Arctia plantaginis TaxID=874455 RepID=A0A8S1AQQ3_ARCPL|nr:unnamed protein product [Arctia plantaginis]
MAATRTRLCLTHAGHSAHSCGARCPRSGHRSGDIQALAPSGSDEASFARDHLPQPVREGPAYRLTAAIMACPALGCPSHSSRGPGGAGISDPRFLEIQYTNPTSALPCATDTKSQGLSPPGPTVEFQPGDSPPQRRSCGTPL